MNHLVGAELLKLRTTRASWMYLGSALALVPLSVALAVTAGNDPLDSAAGVRNVFAAASSGSLMLLVLGILVMAGEFRHGTATSTFLITPDRRRVVSAKLAAAVLVGVALSLAAAVITLAIALPWLRSEGVDLSSYRPEIVTSLSGSIAATALAALVGVGLGALITSQTLAMSIALIWSQVVEGLLVAFVPAVGRWMPGGAAGALSGVATPNGGLLPSWAAAIVLLLYGLAFAGAGAAALPRRDLA